jgi:MHS family proline/betaine transporter-like MFS transporter
MTNTEHSRAGVAPPKADTTTARRAAIAGGVGTLIEYYDFAVYGFLAVIIAPLFFPSTSPGVSILATLAVFGVAYVARPLGGIFFGRLGDRKGRRHALVITVVCMGVACGILGLLPTHSSVGVLAPVLLVIIRLAQGFSAGGEIGGAATYIAESAPPNRRGFFGSFTPVGSTLGFAVAAAVVGLVALITTDEQMSSWGWRIPFLLALPLAFVCLRVRLKLEDSPEFEEMAAKNEVAKSPLSDVVKKQPWSVLRVVGIAIAMNGSGYIGLTYFSVYLINDLGFSKDSVYWTSAVAIALACATFPLSGMLTDRFGRKPVLLLRSGPVGRIDGQCHVTGVLGHGRVRHRCSDGTDHQGDGTQQASCVARAALLSAEIRTRRSAEQTDCSPAHWMHEAIGPRRQRFRGANCRRTCSPAGVGCRGPEPRHNRVGSSCHAASGRQALVRRIG